MRAWAQALSARLGRATGRERLLLGGLVLAALSYAPVAALEWRTAQEDRYIEALTERSAARLSHNAARRVAAAAADDAAVRDMRTWGFEAGNLAVAQVRIEQRLVAAAAGAGLPNARITLEEEVEVLGLTNWLGAEVQADLVWRGVFGLLDGLTGWPEGFRVTSFRYEVRPIPPGLEFLQVRPAAGTVRIGLAFPVAIANLEPVS